MIEDGGSVDAAYTNSRLMSKTNDTSCAGKIALTDPGSESLTDIQKDINDIFTATGIAGENDTNANVYANEFFITNGDSYKKAIETLDSALNVVEDDLSAHVLSEGTTVHGLGTASTKDTTFFDLAGAASAVQENLNIHANETTTHGVSGEIVGTNNTQKITNKSIDDNLQFKLVNTPSNASSGYIRLFADATSGNFKFIDASGTISDIGGGGASALDDLTDVIISSPLANQALLFDASTTTWKNNYAPLSTTAGGKVLFNGATSGTIALQAPSAAGSTTYILPSADGTTGAVLQTSGSGVLAWATVLISPKRCILKDVKASGNSGGSSVSGAWYERTLNTVTGDGSLVSLSSNRFTLQAGKYGLYARSPFLSSGSVMIRLYNVTDAAVVSYGDSGESGAGTHGHGFLDCVFTIASAKEFSIEYRCQLSSASNGLGDQSGFGDETYTVVVIDQLGG